MYSKTQINTLIFKDFAKSNCCWKEQDWRTQTRGHLSFDCSQSPQSPTHSLFLTFLNLLIMCNLCWYEKCKWSAKRWWNLNLENLIREIRYRKLIDLIEMDLFHYISYLVASVLQARIYSHYITYLKKSN